MTDLFIDLFFLALHSNNLSCYILFTVVYSFFVFFLIFDVTHVLPLVLYYLISIIYLFLLAFALMF